jgi:hypothetical protein
MVYRLFSFTPDINKRYFPTSAGLLYSTFGKEYNTILQLLSKIKTTALWLGFKRSKPVGFYIRPWKRSGPGWRFCLCEQAPGPKPSMDRFHEWLKDQVRKGLPKNPITQAISYALNQWAGFTPFLIDGRIELSNNLDENNMRLSPA